MKRNESETLLFDSNAHVGYATTLEVYLFDLCLDSDLSRLRTTLGVAAVRRFIETTAGLRFLIA